MIPLPSAAVPLKIVFCTFKESNYASDVDAMEMFISPPSPEV